MNSELSRLSDLNIEDDILRADFYLRIMRYIKSPEATGIKHTIALDEPYRHDLVSYRIYKTVDLRWLVGLVCGVDDEAQPLEQGETYLFPSLIYVRREMRAFLDEMGLS
ncbi:hypothetical protein I3271_05435 [Photobacterium leiognathi]|uniref:hypothetical protein n=1 Tax=Photobacterium leiognathi TaxID=553611 RepID=UPI001EDE5320|nr:hypothetical protein [Photobacterium leiognathi]MCG3884123.1 hypothetical protein [Photobacterium leiognathi]